MIDSAIIDGIKRKFQRMSAELDERGRRFWAANEAIELVKLPAKVVVHFKPGKDMKDRVNAARDSYKMMA